MRELLSNNSLFVGQLYEDKSLVLRARDLIFFTTDLQTVNITQQFTAGADLFLKYYAIGYMRSYRDGYRILQNSLGLIIFCSSFNDRFILSFLGNHHSLTFQFGSLFSYHY